MSTYGLAVLDAAAALELLATQRVGRVAIGNGAPSVFPVVFALLDGDVVFRTAPGEKLIAAALNQTVTFEADAYDERDGTGWSVNVVGGAKEIVHPDELRRARALDLPPWAGDARDRYVRVRTERVSGRRLDPAP